MLVDGAKYGDVEIPVFCYEPKLGQPVGACRMCLVEIEGIPKLQTACSTPVKDGMVVHTQTDRVKTAQQAVVEFLLINHPLDCPVCDKGGECPLQDISFGWGGGRSRFIEPKRHFEKPLELSPLIAIDRERCILCYRCVRFSPGDLRGLPAGLPGARRAHVRRHLRRPPLRGAVLRQHHRAVPRGRADLAALPLPRPPVGHRGRRRRLHALPGPVQRHLHRPRRARPARPGARPRRGRRRLALRPRPLRLPGDPRRRAHHPADGPRRRRAAPRLLGARAGRGRRRPASARAAASASWPAAARPTRRASSSSSVARETLGTNDIDSRVFDALGRDDAARAARPGAAGDGPRPRVRPHRPRPRRRAGRRHADRRPAHPQGRAPQPRQPGGRHVAPVVAGRQRQAGRPLRPRRRGARRRAARRRAEAAAPTCRSSSPTWSRCCATAARTSSSSTASASWPTRPAPRRWSPSPTRWASAAATAPACSASRPPPTRAACARPASCPFAGPGLAPAAAGRDTARDRRRPPPTASSPRCGCVGVDPLETHPHRARLGRGPGARVDGHRPRRLPDRGRRASTRPSSSRPSRTPSTRARSSTPTAASSACARRSPARARRARAGGSSPSWPSAWASDVRVLTGPQASQQLFAAVPFYSGLTLDLIGGKGLRWVASSRGRRRVAGTADRAAAPRRHDAGRRPGRPTAACAWAPTAPCGRAPRSRNSPRSAVPEGALARRAVAGRRQAPRPLRRREGRRRRRRPAATVEATVSLRAAVPAGSAFLEGNGVDGPLVEIRKGAAVPTRS